jgi:hypothetical protein
MADASGFKVSGRKPKIYLEWVTVIDASLPC